DALLSITEESSSLSESADAEALLSAACELSLAAASELVFAAGLLLSAGFADLSGNTGPLGSTVGPLRARIVAKSGPWWWLARHCMYPSPPPMTNSRHRAQARQETPRGTSSSRYSGVSPSVS